MFRKLSIPIIILGVDTSWAMFKSSNQWSSNPITSVRIHGFLFRSAHRKSQLLHWQILEDGWNVSELVVIPEHSIPRPWKVSNMKCMSRVKKTLVSPCSIGPIIGGYWKSWKTLPKCSNPKCKNDKFHVVTGTLQNAPQNPSSQPAARWVPSQSWAHTLPRRPGAPVMNPASYHPWWEKVIEFLSLYKILQ